MAMPYAQVRPLSPLAVPSHALGPRQRLSTESILLAHRLARTAHAIGQFTLMTGVCTRARRAANGTTPARSAQRPSHPISAIRRSDTDHASSASGM